MKKPQRISVPEKQVIELEEIITLSRDLVLDEIILTMQAYKRLEQPLKDRAKKEFGEQNCWLFLVGETLFELIRRLQKYSLLPDLNHLFAEHGR